MSLTTRLALAPEPVYLMDGSAFVFRGFYAFQHMSRQDGFPTNVLYIVTRILLRLLREERPRHFAFILDGRGRTFRHALFPAYKAQRSATPEPLVRQIPPLCDLVQALGLPLLISEDCEADDYIASLAFALRNEHSVILLGADKDLKQCLHANVLLWDPAAREEKIVTLADFHRENDFSPEAWPDYQALVGDSSDNIPGIPQIGPKTALSLIREFASLENIFLRLAAVPPKTRAKLEGRRESALLYRELTTLRTDLRPAAGLADLAVRPADQGELLRILNTYELRSLIREVESMGRLGLFDRAPEDLSSESPSTSVEPSPAGRPEKTAGQPGKTGEPSPRTQASLFAGLPSPAAYAFPVTPDPSALPGSDAALALFPPGENAPGILIAGRTPAPWERLYTGSLDSLVRELLPRAHSLTLVTPDSKTLRRTWPALRKLPPAVWFDLSLAAYLLSPEDRAYSWPHLSARWGDQDGPDPSAHPGLLLLALHDLFRNRLAAAGLTPVFADLEMPLVPVLADMEERGITIDKQSFARFLAEVQADLETLTSRIHAQSGRTFNIRSGQQLADVLFSVLNLPKTARTRGGAASTSQESLEKLVGKHPVVETILQYRKLEKLRSTYLEPLPFLADAANRVHTTFNQTATATGRLSSSNPNLQNIPIRGPMGGRMRSCFIATKGSLLVCADYSQIELRVLAHLSADPALLDAFRKNEDIHTRTASLLFDLDPASVTAEQRRNAKTINFGIIYGMGAQRLAQELHIPLKEAKSFIDLYFQRLSRLKAFYDTIENEARAHGFVATMTGRRRFIPDILSQNNQLRTQARRQAINTRIQGSAADIIKLAMLAVDGDPALRNLDARLLLQIHDELVLEVPAQNAPEAACRLEALMGAVQPAGQPLSIPLLVSCATGRTWAEAHGA
ncbi:MAG: DNA polymerase I [Desulfovibrio sp.]|jgi:DNA polymerase-1|nr:DNA polymerase I [Desulfovibrio sp.]